MSYVWVDGQAFEPIGDSLDLWLAFLRGNGARQAWMDVSGGEEVCRVIRQTSSPPLTSIHTWRAPLPRRKVSHRSRLSPIGSNA